MKWKIWTLLALAGILAGCTTLHDDKKRGLDRMADNAVAKLTLEFPGLSAELASASGYLVLERSGSGLPMVGKRGYGVLELRKTGERVYVRIKTLEIDGGWGVGDYTGLLPIHGKGDFDQVAFRGWAADVPGKMYIFSGREKPAAYAVKRIVVVPL